MMTTLLILTAQAGGLAAGYLVGAVIALAILGYLVYSLIKPEKF